MISRLLSSFAAVEKTDSVIKKDYRGNAPCRGTAVLQTLAEIQAKGQGNRRSPKRTKNRRMPGARVGSTPSSRREGRDARVADTMESRRFGLCRLISPFSARPLFLPLISSAFREREARFPLIPPLPRSLPLFLSHSLRSDDKINPPSLSSSTFSLRGGQTNGEHVGICTCYSSKEPPTPTKNRSTRYIKCRAC